VLTIAYCRVSTEEQAEEGFSIEGQADKLRAYSTVRDLGEVTVFPDHLEVTVTGAPTLKVLYREIGMRESDTIRLLMTEARREPSHSN
jgi:DNA invertase Pin-like site-specific DNA recombinase